MAGADIVLSSPFQGLRSGAQAKQTIAASRELRAAVDAAGSKPNIAQHLSDVTERMAVAEGRDGERRRPVIEGRNA